MPDGEKTLHSTFFTAEKEPMVVAFRRHTLRMMAGSGGSGSTCLRRSG